MFFPTSKIRGRTQFHSMILFKGYCGWKQSSKGVPVSRLVNVSALSSSVLGFLDAEFGWVTGPHLEKKKNKYLYQRNSFRAFLKNIKAKTPQAILLKSAFWEKDYLPLHLCVCGALNWQDNGSRILHFSKCLLFTLGREERGFTWPQVVL